MVLSFSIHGMLPVLLAIQNSTERNIKNRSSAQKLLLVICVVVLLNDTLTLPSGIGTDKIISSNYPTYPEKEQEGFSENR